MASSSISTAASTSFDAVLLGLVEEVGRDLDLLEIRAERLARPDDRPSS